MSDAPLSRPLSAASVPPEGLDVEIVTNAEERAAIAALNDTISVESFTARFHVTPIGSAGLRVEGRVDASATRTCVVSLEPMVETVSPSIDLRFIPGADANDLRDDAPEPLVGGAVDLGAIACEFFTLALDLHPRKPDAVFEQSGDGGIESPFAALRRLKDG